MSPRKRRSTLVFRRYFVCLAPISAMELIFDLRTRSGVLHRDIENRLCAPNRSQNKEVSNVRAGPGRGCRPEVHRWRRPSMCARGRERPATEASSRRSPGASRSLPWMAGRGRSEAPLLTWRAGGCDAGGRVEGEVGCAWEFPSTMGVACPRRPPSPTGSAEPPKPPAGAMGSAPGKAHGG